MLPDVAQCCPAPFAVFFQFLLPRVFDWSDGAFHEVFIVQPSVLARLDFFVFTACCFHSRSVLGCVLGSSTCNKTSELSEFACKLELIFPLMIGLGLGSVLSQARPITPTLRFCFCRHARRVQQQLEDSLVQKRCGGCGGGCGATNQINALEWLSPSPTLYSTTDQHHARYYNYRTAVPCSVLF